jgi:hypothetical protein
MGKFSKRRISIIAVENRKGRRRGKKDLLMSRNKLKKI